MTDSFVVTMPIVIGERVVDKGPVTEKDLDGLDVAALVESGRLRPATKTTTTEDK